MNPFLGVRWSSAARASVALVAVLAVGCGVRTSPLIGAEAPRDASVADAPFDLGADLGVDLSIVRLPCEADADCPSGTVCRATSSIVPADLTPVPLFCEPRRLAAGADGDACGGADSTGCERELCVIAGTCVVPCRSELDCLVDQRCGQVYARTGAGELQPLSACTDRVLGPPTVRRQFDLAIAGTPGGFEPVGVSIMHSSRTTLALFSAQSGADVYVQALRDPAGALLFDLNTVVPGAAPPSNPLNPAGVALTVLLPSNADLPLGDYPTEVVTDFREVIDRVVLNRDDTGRVLDLDLYYVAGPFTAPAGGPLRRELQAAVDEFGAFYAGVGLTLGEVRTHELVGGLARGYATLEMNADGRIPETDTLFALTAGAQSASVSWFFVQDAEGALGVSGGIPGAQCLPGTAASGIAISSAILGSGVPLASVLIHETGHFLGLFHTSEMDGTVLDPFADTPSCGPDRDTDGDGMLVPSECSGAGADNIMFWAATDAGPFTPSQRGIVARALLLR